jgi:hypothetical protein
MEKNTLFVSVTISAKIISTLSFFSDYIIILFMSKSVYFYRFCRKKYYQLKYNINYISEIDIQKIEN